MKQDIIEKIKVPGDIECSIDNNLVSFKFKDKEIRRKFSFYGLELKKEGSEIIIESKKSTKKELKVIRTIKAHINNMINGLKNPFIYKMEIAYIHFPISVELKEDKLLIKNFLGEKKERTAKILPGVEIKVENNLIYITSNNKELAGQTVSNIEKMIRIRNKDRRKFQDGIYLIEKPGGKHNV